MPLNADARLGQELIESEIMSIQVSIIICTCNRAEHLRQTLESLSSVNVPNSLPTELIIVDNGSTDATPDLIKTYSLPNMAIRYFYEGRRGQANARNTGVLMSQGQIIIFTDDDLRFQTNWLENLCRPVLLDQADAVMGSISLPPHLEKPWMEIAHKNMLASTTGVEARSEFTLIGANMAFSKAILARVPYFDVELGPGALGFMDDSFFSMQLRDAGYRLALALDAEVIHHFDESRLLRASFHSRALNQGRSEAYVAYHWKHHTPTQLHTHLMRQWLRLYYYRFSRRGQHPWPDGMPEWESGILWEIGFDQQMLIERRRARNYEKQGLLKKSGLLWQPQGDPVHL